MDEIQEFYSAIAAAQEPHGAEFETITYPQLWDLYETDDVQFVYWGA
jgi:hypothetical protein